MSLHISCINILVLAADIRQNELKMQKDRHVDTTDGETKVFNLFLVLKI